MELTEGRFDWPEDDALAWQEEWALRYVNSPQGLNPPNLGHFPFVGPKGSDFWGLPPAAIQLALRGVRAKVAGWLRLGRRIPGRIVSPHFTPDGNADLVFTVVQRDGQAGPGPTVLDVVLSDIQPGG